MEEFSNTSVWELLKIMQRKVKDNSIIIEKNMKSVEILKLNYVHSEKREKIINSIYKRNIDLTKENNSLLNLHNSLNKFYNEFKTLISQVADPEIKLVNYKGESWMEYRKACMKKSISGEIKINNHHPFINDSDFFKELMIECQNLELYELCSEIKHLNASKVKIES